jgi:hypothetical protein
VTRNKRSGKMSRTGGVFRVDPRAGMMPGCYCATRHYYFAARHICSPNLGSATLIRLKSAFGTWTVLFTGALELIAIGIAL